MADVTISLRIDEHIHEQMKTHDEVNWSAVLRKYIKEHIDKRETINKDRAKRAAQIMDKLRKMKAFNKGLPGMQVIRAWREKRK